MADTKISDMTAAVTAADADLVPIVQGGVNKKATVDLILDALTAARVATAIGSTAANLVYAGPASGAAAVPAARALVAADIPSLSAVYQPADTTLTALAALASTGLLEQTGVDTFAYRALGVGASTSIPTRADADTRYAALAHAHTGADLSAITNTSIDAAAAIALSKLAAITASVVPVADASGLLVASVVTATELGYVSGVTSAIQTQLGAKADASALNASNLTSGTVPDARFPAVLPAISGANLTNLPGGISGLTAGVIPVATSGTAIGNSKMTTSGTNSGTWTLYDSTGGGLGVSSLVIRGGDGQAATPLLSLRDSASNVYFETTTSSTRVRNTLEDYSNGGGAWIITAGGRVIVDSTGSLEFRASTGGAIDSAIIRSAAGILKVTDGSTGYGRLLAGSLGVNNSAAATVAVGTLANKIEVFDAAGASLGFVPVYATIT